jgi:hypothetical protein
MHPSYRADWITYTMGPFPLRGRSEAQAHVYVKMQARPPTCREAP